MYYPRYELQWRFNLFFCSAILAGAWSGVRAAAPSDLHASLTLMQLLAYALAKMAGIGGYNGWRWIFIIEGLATVVIAIILKPFVADWPESSKFLNPEERQLLLRRLEIDGGEARMDRLDSKARRRAFGDWKIYIGYATFVSTIYTDLLTSAIKHSDVPRRQQHRLQHSIFHSYHTQTAGVDRCACSSPLDTDLHRGCSRLSHECIPDRPLPPSLRFRDARCCCIIHRVYHFTRTTLRPGGRTLPRRLSRHGRWLHHSADYPRLAEQQHGRPLQA